MNLNKRRKLSIALVVTLAMSGAGLAYYSMTTPEQVLNDGQIQQAKNLCMLYHYDKSNPNAHASLGADFHTKQWQDFEQRNGITGARNIDEFCALFQ